MTARFVLVLMPLLAACGGSAPKPETAAAKSETEATNASIEGRYEFTVNLPTQQVRGTLRITADTILVDPVSDYCRVAMGPPDPLYIRYTCQGTGTYELLTLTIDRRNPMQLSKWGATFRVSRRREVCVQYVMRDGRQVCAQMQTETYETTESRSGTLQVRRLPT